MVGDINFFKFRVLFNTFNFTRIIYFLHRIEIVVRSVIYHLYRGNFTCLHFLCVIKINKNAFRMFLSLNDGPR
jgi:hypothetical protein